MEISMYKNEDVYLKEKQNIVQSTLDKVFCS